MSEIICPCERRALSERIGDADSCYFISPSIRFACCNTSSIKIFLSKEVYWASMDTDVCIFISKSRVADWADTNACFCGVVSISVRPSTACYAHSLAVHCVSIVSCGALSYTHKSGWVSPFSSIARSLTFLRFIPCVLLLSACIN